MTTMDVGDRVNVQYAAYAAGVAATATMDLVVTAPDGTTSNPSITLTAPNLYDASFLLDAAGVWAWKWTASGTIDDVVRGQVTAADARPPTYATLAELKSRLGIATTDTTRDGFFQSVLEAASESVENYCDGRRFNLGSLVARTFTNRRRLLCRPDGEQLLVDDIGSGDDLLVEVGDGTTWMTLTDIELVPDNALDKGRAVTALFSPSRGFSWHRLTRVTAKWGWPQVPASVEQAVLFTATRYARRPSSPEGVAGNAEFGLIRIPNIDPDVQAQLAWLKDPKVA